MTTWVAYIWTGMVAALTEIVLGRGLIMVILTSEAAAVDIAESVRANALDIEREALAVDIAANV